MYYKTIPAILQFLIPAFYELLVQFMSPYESLLCISAVQLNFKKVF